MRNRATKNIKIGDQLLELSTPIVMTILNITPDSFWEGSRLTNDADIELAVDRAVQDGGTIIDVGGYSSRPGADEVSVEQELERVRRGVRVVRERAPQIIVSIDTFRAQVAHDIVSEFGACIINDISAGELDPQMIPTVASLGVPYIAMHMRATPATMSLHTEYKDVVAEVKQFLANKIELLRNAGVEDIVIDPGFGFAKSTAQNYQLVYRLDELLELGCPILSGISRKSMLYKVLGSTPAETTGVTAAMNWELLRKGTSILRVHDTRDAADIIRLFNYYTETNGES